MEMVSLLWILGLILWGMPVGLICMGLIVGRLRGWGIWASRWLVFKGLLILSILLEKILRRSQQRYYQACFKKPSSTKNSKSAKPSWKKKSKFVISNKS